MVRPYRTYSIGDLQELATKTDIQLLRQVLHELEHRDSAAATKLHASIERRLGTVPVVKALSTARAAPSASSAPTGSSAESPVAKVIAAARQKLLDLTRRNRLVHFGPGNPESGKPTSDSLVLMGNAEAAWDQVVNEERTKEILVLTEQEQADAIGCMKSGEVEAEIAGHALSTRTRTSGPTQRQPDVDIGKQIEVHIAKGGLISPLPLKASTAKLLTIFRKQETLESSTGDSCLFLAIGFLDWEIEEGATWGKDALRPADKPKQTRVCSPLLLVHVKLKRHTPAGGGDLSFTLEMDVDAPQSNPCLIQKLKSDLDITLPEFDGELHETWSSYIAAITAAVSRKPGCKIHPTICLGFFNFSKYRMWLDLDPANWPNPDALLRHPILAAFAERRPYYDPRAPSPIPSNDEVAAHQAQEDLPILLQADSSQYAALLASRNNKSVTIIGPPGTGKSQTITNLIATALHAGKRVLFVAQKMAALNVVMGNLNKVKVGEFCLPLYTDKSKPSEVHQHFEKAERARKKAPRTAESNHHLTAAAKRLNAIAFGLANVGAYGVTVEVIQAANAARERAQLILGSDFSPEAIQLAIPKTQEAVAAWKSQTDHLLREWRHLLDRASDVWLGWQPIELMASHVPPFMRSLRSWCDDTQALESALIKIDPSLADLGLDVLKEMLTVIRDIPSIEQPSPWMVDKIAGAVSGEVQQVAKLEALVKQYVWHISAASQSVPLRTETPAILVERLGPAVRRLTGGLVHGTRLVDAELALDQINSVHLALTNFRTIAGEHANGVQALGGLTWGTLSDLAEFPHDAVPEIPRQLNQRVVTYLLGGGETLTQIAVLISALGQLREHQQALSAIGVGLGNVDPETQETVAAQLAGLPRSALNEQISAVPEIIATIAEVTAAWQSVLPHLSLLLHRLTVPTIGTVFALSRSEHLSRALALADVDRAAVEAVCNGSLAEAQLTDLATGVISYQAAEAHLAQIRSRLAASPANQEIAIATVRRALLATTWGDRSLDDLRREVDGMTRLEQGRRSAISAADQLLTSWGLASATTSDQVLGTFAMVEALRTFPCPVIPEQLGRWAEAPIQATVEAMASTAQPLIQERTKLAEIFLLSEAPEPEAIAALKQTFLANRGPFRWFSSKWRAARNRVMGFCSGELPKAQEIPVLLERLATWKRSVAALDKDGIGAMALGAQWKALDSNWSQVRQIVSWVRELRHEALGNVLRWLTTTQVAGLQPTSIHTSAIDTWTAWHASTCATALPPSLDEQAQVMSSASSQIGRLVAALDTLGAQGVVTPSEVLQVVDAYAASVQAALDLEPFSMVAAGRSWTQVRPQAIRDAKSWINELTAAGVTLRSVIDLLVGDARTSLRTTREAISGIDAPFGRLRLRIGIEETCHAEDVVTRLDATRAIFTQVRPTVAQLHLQREPTLALLVDALQRAQRIRALASELEPWSRELGQGLSSADLEPITVSTDWTRAVCANHVPEELVRWMVAADPDHRATWWRRLATSANQVESTIDIACSMGMLNIADATTDRPVAVWHDELPRLLADWRSSLDLLTTAAATKSLTLSDVTRGLESLAQAAAIADELATYDDRVGFPATSLTPDIVRAHWALVAQARKLPTKMCGWLLGSGTRAALDQVFTIPVLAKASFERAAHHLSLTERFGRVTTKGPCGTCMGTQTVTVRRQSIEKLIGSEAMLLPYADLLRMEKRLVDAGLGQFLDAVRPSRPTVEDTLAVFASVVLYRQAETVIQANSLLANFTGSRHQAERAEFAEHDFSMLKKNRSRILSAIASRGVAEGRGGRVTADMTQRALLDKERSKQRKHFPIRKVVSRAGKAMQDLCPCWLMTPLAVAQHLAPGAIEFDLVVMDEASQLTPEDAFGAIARGREVVIVGDPAQMPPSNFFQSTTTSDTDEEDEDAEAATAESVLELAKTSLPESSLLWHYRSQHQELIAPANAFSYHHRLIIFPSAVDRRDDRGIKHHYVPDGFFRTQVNAPEAAAVVSFLVKTLRSFKTVAAENRPTIGVLTMNARQQEAIISLLDQARQGDAVVAKILMEEESRSSESLIVRNLENFQGDQRDIMVISCTYGPEHPGTDKVHQRFRSINGTAGRRRFNVAITRAKQQMVVFSSIRSEQVLIGEGKNEGVTDFYKFLRYCEADRRTAVPDLGEETGNAMDSPFEEAVAEFLRSKGYDVEPQVGVCGYFIDLGIRHPRDKGRFALGIECDGATYHSSRAARDRDYLRESILRDRDWEIYRIWSTDWFHEQVKAKQALLRAVRKACS